MRLEAVVSFTYRWPGGEVHLDPGTPIELPDERAQRLLNKAPGKVRVCPPTIQPGARITWQRADLSIQYGVVDFLHPDGDGTVWAFCTRPDGGWTAVNTKQCTKSAPS
jgi:hypothetical protein